MKVLGLCSYPVEAAATRFRMAQFVGPLRERGIELTISPFLSSEQFRGLYRGSGLFQKAASMIGPIVRRIGETAAVKKYDLIFVQREAMIFGPGIFEWLMQKFGGIPMVLDLDDATYVRYKSPSYGNLGSALKFFGKTDNLIKRASAVTCGNRFIAEYVSSKGARGVVIPTVVDAGEFYPVEKSNSVPVLGWIGTHSTYPFLESLFPVLARLAEKHNFVLKIVGAGKRDVELEGPEIINTEWDLGREVTDFQTLDIGLYPMRTSDSANLDWLQGKSGFKAIQYMSVGVPFVMSPVGVAAELGIPGETHFNAETDQDWYGALDRLLSSPELRAKMGMNGFRFSEDHFGVPRHADMLERVFREVTTK